MDIKRAKGGKVEGRASTTPDGGTITFGRELRAEAASEDEEEEAEVLDGKGGEGAVEVGDRTIVKSLQDNYDYFLQLPEPNTWS